MYKTIIDYKTENGYFTETFIGTLSDNLRRTNDFLGEDILTANIFHKAI